MGLDSFGGIRNRRGLWELELDLDRNWTGESDRCDRTLLDPEQELMFQSLIDVIGLLVDPGPRLLGWTFCLAGPRQLGRNQERNWRVGSM